MIETNNYVQLAFVLPFDHAMITNQFNPLSVLHNNSLLITDITHHSTSVFDMGNF